jgi:hypothetical protein
MRLYFKLALIITLILCAFTGCSGASNPASVNPDETPLAVYQPDVGQSQTGIFGAYSAVLNTSTLEFEMVPLRHTAIGESFIVDAMSFFTVFPCTDCFSVSGIRGDASSVTIRFRVDHPLPAGNIANPPSGMNRLDLDVFDLAVVIWPLVMTAPYYPLLDQYVMSDFCINQSGYTVELSNVYLTGTYAMPYFLVVDDSITGISTYNKFAMGDSKYMDVSFKATGGYMNFNMYLTMGYGASSTFWQRLTPKYYNPEFNRKPAWKITATPQDHWIDNSLIPVNVRVEVYDWQQGATVCANPSEFNMAPANQIYSQSDCQGVWIEIPGMYTNTFFSNIPDSGTGMPGDPLVYTVQVTNFNFLPAGQYTGLAMTYDTRIADHSGSPGRDCVIHSPDGVQLTKYDIPFYNSYQTFTADVWAH